MPEENKGPSLHSLFGWPPSNTADCSVLLQQGDPGWISSVLASRNRRWQSTCAPTPACCNSQCWIAQSSPRGCADPLCFPFGWAHAVVVVRILTASHHMSPQYSPWSHVHVPNTSPKTVVLPLHAKWITSQCSIPSLSCNLPGSVGWKHIWPTAWTRAP